MPPRFALRIESGEQAGETHAIPGKGLTVGRRPGNDLVIRDASISGRHARFSIEDGRVVIVDFGSTNGSFVGDERVEQRSLEAGAFLRLGAIELELIEQEAEAVPAMAAPARAAEPDEIQLEQPDSEPQGQPEPRPMPAVGGELEIEGLDEAALEDFDDDGEGMHRIDGEALAKAKQGPGLVPLLLGVLILGGAGAWVWLGMPGLGGGGATESGPARPVRELAGNLLADPSFESKLGVTQEPTEDEPEGGAWQIEETAAVTPFVSEAWRAGGDVGLGVDLDAGEASRVRSRAVRIGRQRGLSAQAVASTEGGGVARLGVELSDELGEHPVFIAWGPAARAASEQELAFELTAPPAYDQARLVLEFMADTEPGAVGFDEVGLVAGAGGQGLVSSGDFSLAAMGPDQLALSFIDRPLIVDLVGAEPRVTEAGLGFAARGGRLAATLDPGLLAEGLATLGAAGYQPHADAFEDASVDSLVIGSGVHQLRLVFPSPVALAGRPVAGGYRLEAGGVSGELEIELGFSQERARAARLASDAKRAEGKHQRGLALAKWRELLDAVPFDGELVLEAEAASSRLVATGMAELEALRQDYTRAAFFGLPDLYHDCLDGVLAVQVEFAGSEVASAAEELAQEVATTLAELGARDPRAARLAEAQEAVLELTQEQGLAKLSAHIQASLADQATEEGH